MNVQRGRRHRQWRAIEGRNGRLDEILRAAGWIQRGESDSHVAGRRAESAAGIARLSRYAERPAGTMGRAGHGSVGYCSVGHRAAARRPPYRRGAASKLR